MPLLPCAIVEPDNGKADATVILLHGLGADGHDFVPIVPELKLPKHTPVRFVFPHAPIIPITINSGMSIPAWYDILTSKGAQRTLNHSQLKESANAVCDLIIHEQSKGIHSKRIIIAGFSQGGAVAYEAALSFNEPLAGLMALSTYFPSSTTLIPSSVNASLPIHLFHGSQDSVVPEVMGRDAMATLRALGYKADYKSYSMRHELHPQEIKDISIWIQKVLRKD